MSRMQWRPTYTIDSLPSGRRQLCLNAPSAPLHTGRNGRNEYVVVALPPRTRVVERRDVAALHDLWRVVAVMRDVYASIPP